MCSAHDTEHLGQKYSTITWTDEDDNALFEVRYIAGVSMSDALFGKDTTEAKAKAMAMMGLNDTPIMENNEAKWLRTWRNELARINGTSVEEATSMIRRTTDMDGLLAFPEDARELAKFIFWMA